MTTPTPDPRTGMPSPKLDRAEFRRRFLGQYIDPGYDQMRGELERIADAAWDAYSNERKAPLTRKAGPGYADPDHDLALDWIAGKDAIERAQLEHDHQAGPSRVLLINGAARSEHTCPSEISKSWRLTRIAEDACLAEGVKTELLDLSRLISEYGRHIHPCKTCFSTAAALCHWPCSCYPNYSLGQTGDMMNEIYPMWVRAHGVILVTPVNWYSPSSPMKLMMDRLVCADGGNPDETSTSGKDAKKAKELELAGWPYPRHLAGRVFGVIVHGDSIGAETVRRGLSDWLTDMHLESAGSSAELDRYIGYWEPYATSHEALDQDRAIQEEVRNVARTVVNAIRVKRAGGVIDAGAKLDEPRQK